MVFCIRQIVLHRLRSKRPPPKKARKKQGKSPKQENKSIADSVASKNAVTQTTKEASKAVVVAMTQASEESRMPATDAEGQLGRSRKIKSRWTLP